MECNAPMKTAQYVVSQLYKFFEDITMISLQK
jgi:hypothetical protein